MCRRAQEVVALAENDKINKPDECLRFADVYHSANRYATSSKDCTPVILPSSMIYDFERGRLLLGLKACTFHDSVHWCFC